MTAPITIRAAAKRSGEMKCRPTFITGQFAPHKMMTKSSSTSAVRGETPEPVGWAADGEIVMVGRL
jgi:hypothetical protein